MLGVTLHNQLHITRLATFTGLGRRNEDVCQFSLNLRMQVDLRLFHPDSGMRWAVEGLYQSRQHLGNTEAHVRDLHLGRFGMGLHQHFVFLSTLRHRPHSEVMNHAQVFEPRRYELGKALGVPPDLPVESAPLTLRRQDGCHSVLTHLPDAGGCVA